MNYAELRDPDGKAYKCTICNVVAVLDETVVESVEIKSFEQPNGETVEREIEHRKHTLQCPNDVCEKTYEVFDTRTR